MRKTIAAFFTVLLSLSTPVGWAQAQAAHRASSLPPELRAAFDAMAKRDPGTHAGIERLLERDPDAALRHLEHYAASLHERAEAEKNDPERFALIQKQERAESAVRGLVQQAELAPTADERARLMDQLRRELDGWFDVRQAMRELDIGRFAAKLDAERASRADRGARRDALREEWLARLTEGGPQAMRQRIEALSAEDVLPVIAPLLVQSMMREDPRQGEALVALSQSDEAKFQEALRHLVDDRPGLVEQARLQASEAVRVHEALRAAAREAHVLLLPRTTEGRPDLADAAVRQALDRVIDAEAAVADANLRQAEGQLAATRAALAERAARKSLIVDIQLARITGRADEFEW